MDFCETAYQSISARLASARAASGGDVRLLAVSKTQPAGAIRALHGLGQRAFGENYVQEAIAKQRELAAFGIGADAIEWHLIGPLQSNKAREAARHFDWLQSLDREKLIEPLSRHRAGAPTPLNMLIQVNVDDEASKSGCAPEAVADLARQIAQAEHLRLRGLMAIPEPTPDLERRRAAFRRMRTLFDALRAEHAGVDTLSMGMSEDFELAIAEGATMVRIGSALFGARLAPSPTGERGLR